MKNCFLIFFLISYFSHAQQEHAWVYFKDKPNVEEALAHPQTILSQRAIERKTLHHTPIDERDIPVNETYISQIKQQEGITYKAKSKWLNCIHVLGSVEAIENLASLDFVSRIEYANDDLNQRFLADIKKIDAKLENAIDFNYGFAANQVQMLHTDSLHKNDFTGGNMIIAVLDAGFPNVKFLDGFKRIRDNGKLLGGYNFPDRSEDFSNPALSNHGTLVLSTIAGYIPNRFAGTAPDASFYLFRTEIGASETPVEESYWVEAAERADSLGVDVINSSLSYSLFDNPAYNYSLEDMNGQTAFVSRSANIATEKGILVVVSAGNSAESDVFPIIGAPADANVLTVGAVDKNKNYVSFSSIGPSADNRIKPDVMAQGLEVVAIDEFDDLVSISGTSFSSPIMAGSVASFWQSMPSYSNLEIMDMVRASSSMFNNPNNKFGYGIPDFSKALNSTENDENNLGEFAISPNPVEDILQIQNSNTEKFRFLLFDTLGQKLLEQEGNDYEIDLSGFSRGIYIAMFEQNNTKESVLIIKK